MANTPNLDLKIITAEETPSWLTDFNGNMDKLDENAGNLSGNLDVVKADITNLQSADAIINRNIDSLSNRVSTAETNITNDHAAISSLQTSMTKVQDDLITQNTAVKQAQTDISTLNSRVSGMQNDIDDNAGDIAGLDADVTSLQAGLTAMQSSVADAQNTANTAKSKADTAKSTADTAKSTADTAKSTADSASTKASRVESSVGSLGTQFTSFRSKAAVFGSTLYSPSTGGQAPIRLSHPNTTSILVISGGKFTRINPSAPKTIGYQLAPFIAPVSTDGTVYAPNPDNTILYLQLYGDKPAGFVLPQIEIRSSNNIITIIGKEYDADDGEFIIQAALFSI